MNVLEKLRAALFSLNAARKCVFEPLRVSDVAGVEKGCRRGLKTDM